MDDLTRQSYADIKKGDWGVKILNLKHPIKWGGNKHSLSPSINMD